MLQVVLSGFCYPQPTHDVLSGIRAPKPLPQSALAALNTRGYCAVPNWLDAKGTDAILRDALLCETEGLPRRAGVGSTRTGETAVRQDTSTRRSSMLPLYPPPRPSAGDVDTRMALGAAVSALREELSAPSSGLALPQLSPFQTELAYLFYPAGGFYLRHVDVPSVRGGWTPLGRSAEDGGSFSRAATRREISMLLYLNRGWDPAWGGALRVYHGQREGGDGSDGMGAASEGGGGDDEAFEDISPEGGTLVLMHSDRVPHEVLETLRPRHCVVGWLRALRDESPS